MSEMQPFYVSFGSKQVQRHREHGLGWVSEDGLVLFWAKNETAARHAAITAFGQVWSAMYIFEDLWVSAGGDIRFFPLGVTKAFGTPVSVEYQDARKCVRMARFENYVEADAYANWRASIEGSDCVTSIDGPDRASFRHYLDPSLPI